MHRQRQTDMAAAVRHSATQKQQTTRPRSHGPDNLTINHAQSTSTSTALARQQGCDPSSIQRHILPPHVRGASGAAHGRRESCHAQASNATAPGEGARQKSLAGEAREHPHNRTDQCVHTGRAPSPRRPGTGRAWAPAPAIYMASSWLEKLGKSGEPRPVRGSQPLVAVKPYWQQVAEP